MGTKVHHIVFGYDCTFLVKMLRKVDMMVFDRLGPSTMCRLYECICRRRKASGTCWRDFGHHLPSSSFSLLCHDWCSYRATTQPPCAVSLCAYFSLSLSSALLLLSLSLPAAPFFFIVGSLNGYGRRFVRLTRPTIKARAGIIPPSIQHFVKVLLAGPTPFFGASCCWGFCSLISATS